MQITQTSENLSEAILFLEELLNNKNADVIIEKIKDYKKTKNIDEIKLN